MMDHGGVVTRLASLHATPVAKVTKLRGRRARSRPSSRLRVFVGQPSCDRRLEAFSPLRSLKSDHFGAASRHFGLSQPTKGRAEDHCPTKTRSGREESPPPGASSSKPSDVRDWSGVQRGLSWISTNSRPNITASLKACASREAPSPPPPPHARRATPTRLRCARSSAELRFPESDRRSPARRTRRSP